MVAMVTLEEVVMAIQMATQTEVATVPQPTATAAEDMAVEADSVVLEVTRCLT